MTQPIQEPSTQRSVSGLVWGESQLARRPGAPTPTNLLSWGKRYSLDAGDNIPDSTEWPLAFLQTGTTYAAVSDTADIEILDDTVTFGDGYGFTLHRRGMWRLRIVLDWDDNPGFGQVWVGTSTGAQVLGLGTPEAAGNPGQRPIIFEVIWPHQGGDQDLFPYFLHNSGADRNLFAAIFTALWLGDFDGGSTAVNMPF